MDQNPDTSRGKHLAEMLVDSLCGLATEEEMETVRVALIAEQKRIDDIKTNEVTPANSSTDAEIAPVSSRGHFVQSIALAMATGPIGLAVAIAVQEILRSSQGERGHSSSESLVQSADKSKGGTEGTPKPDDSNS